MPHPAQGFVDDHVRTVEPLAARLCAAWWDASITGSDEHAAERARLEAELTRIYADADEFARLKAWHVAAEGGDLGNGTVAGNGHNADDPLLVRQIGLLYRAYLGNQKDEATIERMVALETKVDMTYNNHRGEFDGEPTADNDLRRVLTDEADSDRCRRAWEASKQVAPNVAADVLELVRLRNKVATDAGYANHYTMQLELQELDEDDLSTLLGDLEGRTREPFRSAKAKLDTFLAGRFGTDAEQLRPWHYGDFFFQEAPATDAVDLAPLFADKDIVELATATYDRIGLETRDVLARSDLYAKDGKSQHAFCISIDRKDDVRTLCNLKPDERWMSTLLHELGHAVYDVGIDRELPFLLREPAHTLLTEAVAMIAGRLTKDGYWLRTVAKVDAAELDKVLPHIEEFTRVNMLVFVRWCLVMTHFERDLYRDPSQDLDTLWWDYVERFQMLTRPPGRDEPDWAAKIHLALAPVYYHNYLLGEMVASQIHRYIVDNVDPHGVTGGTAVGEYMEARLFAPGAKYRWDETVERATGERLDPRYFAEQFVVG